MTARADEVIHTVKVKPLLKWQGALRGAIHSEAKFIVAVMGRRAGKTSCASRMAGEFALHGKEVFWGAPTYDLAALGKDRFHEMYGEVVQRRREAPPEAYLWGGGVVRWRSFDRPGSALGRGNDLVIIDEAARVKKQIVYEEVLPTIGDTGGKIVAITTPRGRRSWVFDWYNKARAGDPLYAVIHGPSTENPSPTVQEFVGIARDNMPDNLFRQEIMAEFLEGEGAVFRNILDNATEAGYLDAPAPGNHYIIGADVAKHQDWTVCYVMDAMSGAVVAVERYQHVDWPMVKARIKGMAEKWNAPIWLDATGVGDPIFDDLCSSGVPVVPIKFTSESKSALVVSLMNAMEKGEISYPLDDVLIGELEAFGYEELPSGKFRYSAPEGQHDDCVMALALAVWGKNRSAHDFGGWL